MSALEGLRRQIESANTAVGELLTELVALRARVGTLEARVAQPTATPQTVVTRGTTPPAQAVTKPTSTSAPAAPVTGAKSAPAKS